MSLERPAILLADTDTVSQDLFRTLSETRGWDCTIVSNVEALGRELDRAGYDIVIADSEMPGLTPGLLVGEVFRTRPSQALLVIGDSVTSENGLKLLRSGATDVITKPVDFAWLERCVEQAASAKRLQDRERLTYKFVSNERTEMKFSCRELGEAQAISLPIVERLMHSRRLRENDALKIKLAVQEAVLNAVEHGNLELDSTWKEELMTNGADKFSCIRRERLADPAFAERTVSIVSDFNGERIEIVVKDEGRGFLHAGDSLSRVNDNLSCFGRGLTLMSNAVDEVRYKNGGAEVTLIKYLPKN